MRSAACLSTTLFALIVLGFSPAKVCAIDTATAQLSTAPSLAAPELHFEMKEEAIKKIAGMSLDAAGCFGEKHQYIYRSGGATIVVTTLGGTLKSVRFVAPSMAGFTREQSLVLARKVLSDKSKRKQVEHDDTDRVSGDMTQSVEYFYYDDGSRVELIYAKNSNELIETFLVGAK